MRVNFSELTSFAIEKHIKKSQEQVSDFARFKGKPFYCWSDKVDNCFTHLVGLPEKEGRVLPLFDYERQIYDDLKRYKYIWIKKATGLGITEFFLRYISWRCLVNDEWSNSKVCIVTGPRIELAITLIDRIKRLFIDIDTILDTRQTVVILNSCKIEAYPSHHIDTMRGLTDVKMILLDEAAFFPPGQQREVRYASERYIGKSDPYIIMISTPNRPDDMFASIDKEL